MSSKGSAVSELSIAGRRIADDEPVYVIAELSGNHNGELQRALRLIDAAAEAGADAVKLQTYTADTITLACDGPDFRIEAGLWSGRTLHDLYQEASMPWDWQPRLKQHAERLGMACFSSPFDFSAVEFLEEMDVPAYKIASFELTDIPLIRRVAATGKPVIMSTGLATMDEVAEAVEAAREGGAADIALLKCTSAYPAEPDEMNLRAIGQLRGTFGVQVGLSDHTMATTMPVIAVALGARIIEKHLTLARDDGGPDSGFSLEPAEFAAMVSAVRVAERALGAGELRVGERERASLRFRRSLYVVEDVAQGEELSAANVRSIRPAGGLHPRHLEQVLGQRAAQHIPKGTALVWRMIERS